ncbi:MAG TPA: hypothetical protein VGG33_11960 [Polyangia bacterium]
MPSSPPAAPSADVPPTDLTGAYLPGLAALVAHDERALAAFAGRALDHVRKDALNHGVFAAALLQALPPRRPLRVGITGMSPVTEPLIRGLTALPGVTACVVDEAYQTTAPTIFEVPFFSTRAAAGACDSWIDPKVDLRNDIVSRPDARTNEAPAVIDARAPEVAAAHARLIAAHRDQLSAALGRHLGETGDRVVVFVAQKVQYNQLRFSRALQRRGYKTVSVLFDPNFHEQQRGFFDDVIVTDLLSFLVWVNHAPAALLHTQGWLFRYHVPGLIQAFKARGVAQICEMMDLNSFWFPPAGLEAQLPLLQKVWGDDCRDNHLTQCACERMLFERADGVVFEGDEGHQRALGLGTEDPRYLNFPTYPLPEFFADHTAGEAGPHKEPQDLRLVFAAGVIPTGGRHLPEIFADAQWHRTANQLLALGCTVHVYNNPGHGAPATYPHKYPEHLALARRYARYRFEPGALPGAIAARIADYDYGLMLYDFDGVIIGEEHFANMIPSKFFMFLEAGLPVLVSDRWRAVCDLVRAFDIGRAIAPDEQARLPEVLATLNPRAHRQNVRRAREVLSVDRQIRRLVALYERARTHTEDVSTATLR